MAYNSRRLGPRPVPAWTDHAACAADDIDRAAFHEGASTAQVSYAKDVCASCPVRLPCLGYAIEYETPYATHLDHGLWGGMTTDERRRARRRAQVAARGSA